MAAGNHRSSLPLSLSLISNTRGREEERSLQTSTEQREKHEPEIKLSSKEEKDSLQNWFLIQARREIKTFPRLIIFSPTNVKFQLN